jgi:hypothetical protein
MILTTRTKLKFLKIADVYFADTPEVALPRVDIAQFVQFQKRTAPSTEFRTLHVDLTRDEDALFAELRNNTRNEVRRAEHKDGIVATFSQAPSRQELIAFGGFYDSFADAKNLPRCNMAKIVAHADHGTLWLTSAANPDGDVVCYHAYIVDSPRCRLLYSASHFRASADPASRGLIGRANRYLHWRDIVLFKQHRFFVYDFGGLSANEDDPSLKNINDFKRGFGGKEVVEFNWLAPRTALGWLAFLYLKAQQR